MFEDFCAVIEKVVAEDLQKEESSKEKTNEVSDPISHLLL